MQRKHFVVDHERNVIACCAVQVWHIAKALGWVGPAASREAAYDHLNARVPDDIKYDLHVLLVEHGKRCSACSKRSSTRRCDEPPCPLASFKRGRGCGGTGKGAKAQMEDCGESGRCRDQAPASGRKRPHTGLMPAAKVKVEEPMKPEPSAVSGVLKQEQPLLVHDEAAAAAPVPLAIVKSEQL